MALSRSPQRCHIFSPNISANISPTVSHNLTCVREKLCGIVGRCLGNGAQCTQCTVQFIVSNNRCLKWGVQKPHLKEISLARDTTQHAWWWSTVWYLRVSHCPLESEGIPRIAECTNQINFFSISQSHELFIRSKRCQHPIKKHTSFGQFLASKFLSRTL